MSAMTFTEDNCGTYPPSYPQRESLRLQRYNKLINCARFLAKKCGKFTYIHDFANKIASCRILRLDLRGG